MNSIDINSPRQKIGTDLKLGKNIHITAKGVFLGDRVEIKDDVTIIALEGLIIGPDSIIGKGAQLKAREISIGRMFYSDDNPTPLVIGGGGWNRPNAKVSIGDNCVIHDSFINCYEPVTIGDNVGMSPGSAILTHGFWNPVTEGYRRKTGPVVIGHDSFVGYRSVIMPGVSLGNYTTVGANSTVTHDFPGDCIIGGSPAQFIGPNKREEEMLPEERQLTINTIILDYLNQLRDKIDVGSVHVSYDNSLLAEGELILHRPSGKFHISLRDYSWLGVEDEISDDFRDFLRHYGIRVCSRPFKSLPYKLERELGLK